VEVDIPPLGDPKAELDIRSCSMMGCDLAHWYRVGWNATPPQARPEITVASGAARIDQTPLPMLACKSSTPAIFNAATRSNSSPEDLGIGNAKVAIANDNSDTAYTRTPFNHSTMNPPHGETGGSDGDEQSLRMLMHGFATDSGSGSHFVVLGPAKDPLLLRRSVGFVAPFDTTTAVRRASFGISDLVTAARAVGMTSADVLGEDPSIPTVVVPVLESDPSLGADLAFTSDLGMVGVVRSSGRIKVTLRPTPQDSISLVSGAAVGTDDLALLEVDSNGLSHISRWTGSAITALYDINAPPTPDLYPANPDALAVYAKGDFGIIRTPSGSEPPTTSVPALLYQNGQPVQQLAAWSTLTSADDPLCKSDPGFRAIIQTVHPWFRLPPELTEAEARMIARVKWSQTRVCLEGVEIRTPDVKANVLTRGDDPNERAYSQAITIESWLVAKMSGTSMRAGVGAGVEWRQPYACTLQP
jgi:hypothetical protein